ncbi:hypothetical protein M408DRAFT_23982 [Serendipita vermifera MAFF 305830]|uniref:Amidase domain-containing protein n=1 Tax=Serendipita vermifera MAFF 305830 TaxID=933852 RepID=A0A0C2XGN2_SERVB|nr:hypothetical protein M408DRAFT_23982 [Serendipita vermifera MAFF 305830]
MTTLPSDAYVVPDLYDATIDELLKGLDEGHFTVVQLVSAYISRIEEVNLVGAQLRSVLEINAAALQQAARCDEERAELVGSRKDRAATLGPLHGIPILIKDNIATASPVGWNEQLNTSAGSFALKGCYPAEDATVARKLRAAGAIILGKTNMSEWAHWRGNIPSGWSSIGGQCTSPYCPGADPSGSSSGSAVAATVGLAAATLGTETDGSITFPSSLCNIVGLKPTVGLTSRTGVIPISETQDSVGPMGRTVFDVAHFLQVISGPDESDAASMAQPSTSDYLSAINTQFIRGKRIGVLSGLYIEASGRKEHELAIFPHTTSAFTEALEHMRNQGAELVKGVEMETLQLIMEQREKEFRVCRAEFKTGLNDYLSRLPSHPNNVKTLEDVIQFNRSHPETHFRGEENQHHLIESNQAVTDELYRNAVEFGREKGGKEGIDNCLKKHNLDLLVAPWSRVASVVPAVSGYPILTMPLGFYPESIAPYSKAEGFPPFPAPGLPFGIVFIGGKWTERTLLGCAYSLEQSMKSKLGELSKTTQFTSKELENGVNRMPLDEL